jgi:hypothetical protein
MGGRRDQPDDTRYERSLSVYVIATMCIGG